MVRTLAWLLRPWEAPDPLILLPEPLVTQ